MSSDTLPQFTNRIYSHALIMKAATALKWPVEQVMEACRREGTFAVLLDIVPEDEIGPMDFRVSEFDGKNNYLDMD